MIMKELSICIENVILYVTDNVRDCLLALVCYSSACILILIAPFISSIYERITVDSLHRYRHHSHSKGTKEF